MGEKIQQWRINASGTLDRKGLGHSSADLGVPVLDGCLGVLAMPARPTQLKNLEE